MNRRDLIKGGLTAATAGVLTRTGSASTPGIKDTQGSDPQAMAGLVSSPSEIEPLLMNENFSEIISGMTADNMRRLCNSANADDCSLYNSLYENRLAELYRKQLLAVQSRIYDYAITGHSQLTITIYESGTKINPIENSAVARMVCSRLIQDGFLARTISTDGKNSDYDLQTRIYVRW